MTTFPGNECLAGLPPVILIPMLGSGDSQNLWRPNFPERFCSQNVATLLYVVADVFNSNVQTILVAIQYVELNAKLCSVQDCGALDVEKH